MSFLLPILPFIYTILSIKNIILILIKKLNRIRIGNIPLQYEQYYQYYIERA